MIIVKLKQHSIVKANKKLMINPTPTSLLLCTLISLMMV